MTIASALDKLNDKLAGSDQPASQTIEGMILRLIDNIDQGGGGSIPIASADTLGGIKVGENLSITEGGVLSASGGGGGGLVCNVTIGVDETRTLDKTAGEIFSACESGQFVWTKTMIGDEYTYSFLMEYGVDDQGNYFVGVSSGFTYYAATENDYPVAS